MRSRAIAILARLAFTIACAITAFFVVFFSLVTLLIPNRCGIEANYSLASLYVVFAPAVYIVPIFLAGIVGYAFRAKALIVTLVLLVTSYGAVVVQ